MSIPTGSVAGEAVYFTIEYNYSADKSHSIGMWSDCVNDSLTGCQTSYYNFDDVAGVCATGLAANTTLLPLEFLIITSIEKTWYFDVIEFTVETSNSIPDDECANCSYNDNFESLYWFDAMLVYGLFRFSRWMWND